MGAVSSVVDSIGDIGQGAINAVSDVGSSIDDAVNDNIPGGWATIAAVTAATMGMPPGAFEGATGSAGSMAAADAVYGGATTAAGESALASALPASAAVATPVATSALETSPLSPLAESAPYGSLGSGTYVPAGTPTGLESFATPAPATSGISTLQPAGFDYVSGAPLAAESAGIGAVSPVTPVAATTSAVPGVGEAGWGADLGGAGAGSGIAAVPDAMGTTAGLNAYETALPTAGIGVADALKYAGLAGLAAGVLSPDQPQQPQAVPQTPVGVGLSPDYQPYRYKPYAMGGLTALAAGGGPVEQMSNANAIGANTGYPMADIMRGAYATPYQQPISQNVLSGAQDTRVDPYTGEEKLAGGGIANLGGYSDGGRLLRGPGDGVSDSIPAVIGGKQPARLADGEFVIPARIVSELGNGSTEAGARQLYAMMDRIQRARSKTIGKNKVAKDTRAAKHLPV